ncbi:nuclear pore complex protein Nup214 [Anoplophora glabripennis]|nr:nuclear pore complex protein Nup214 [Anoplophora glabripennis]
MFKTCPDPIDVQDLQFKLHCRLKVFDNKLLDTFPKSNSLVSCASRYGLLFVGSNTSNLQVIQVKCVENYTPKDKDISNYSRRNVPLPSRPQHICVNCDSTILAVVTERDNCPSVAFYDVFSFLKQNISIIKEVRLSSTPGTYVKEIGWNPTLPLIFTACKSDGTLGVYEIKGVSININELPAASEATCFCWSPKGKQIAVGSRNSRITQYKPDLKAVKVVNQPPLEGAHSLISLQWVSNYQFIGIYQSAEPEGTAKLIVVDAPKTGDPVYTNYEDVCYSGTTRLPQFYMILQQHWNILMVASSNSTELGVLGSTGDTWTQWIISDSARPELPLSPDRQETLPVGLALDISSTRPLPWNESTIPPCPYLLILSHHGVLCFFSVVNLKEGVPSICAPPDPVSDLSGIQQFVTPVENTPIQPTESAQVPPPSVSVTPVSQATVFGAKVLTQPQPTYAAPATLFGAKPTDNKPLFGGQTTLTPIKPQQSAAQPSFGGQTFITPINKQQTGTANVTVNPAEKYSAIFSALNTPTAIPATTDNKTITIPILNIPKPAPPVEQSVAAQQNVSVTSVKPVEPPKPVANLKIKEETDVLLAQMLRDESTSLESELKALLHQGRLVNITIGSEDEKIELVTKIEYLQEFIKEIVDISIGENAEVHYLKQNLIQSWAWYEEARSRYNASKDETVSLLLRSQPLDSATEKKQADIRKMMYYIESQITQASKALDEQWDNFQDYAKKVHRTKMPTMEAIFQAMVRQNVIVQKQCYVLKDIAGRLKGRGRAPNVPSLLLSIENTKDLEDSLNRLKIEHPQDMRQVQYQRVLNRMKNLSETKTNKLRNLLKNQDVFHITAAKPQLSSSLMLQSPESKSKRLLSNLATVGTPLSPLSVTAPVPKALSFAHSTPIRETKPEIKPMEALPSTTQTDAKLFTFKKAEKSNLTATTNTFIPLSKSASVFSNLPQENLTQAPLATHTPSAFVPTQVFGGGSKFSFTSTTTTTTASATRTAPISATPAPTYSFAAGSSTLPKFSAPTTPKTPDTVTNLPKPTLPQFSFGGGLTIAPIGAIKKDVTTTVAANTPTFGSAATTKPSFSFGGTSSLFGAKAAAGVSPSPQAIVTTTSNLFFTQINKPPSDTATSTPPSTFGKLSAFSAVTTGASNAVKNEDLTQTKPSAVTSKFTTDAGLTKSATTSSSFYGFGGATTVAKPTLTSVDSTKLSTISATVAPSVFGTAAAKPLYQTSSAPSTTTEVTSTKQSSTFSTPSTTASISTVSSGTLTFNVTTSTSTKPITSPTSSAGTGVSVPSLFFGGAQSASTVSSTVPSSTVFSSNTPIVTTKPSVFGLATAIPQITLATPALSSQLGFSVGSPQLQETSTSSGVSQTTSGTAVTVTQLQIFGTNKSTVSGDSTTTQPVFGPAKTTAAQPSGFEGAQSTTSGVSTATQPTSVFGNTKTTATSQPSVFDSAVTSSQPSIFGGSQSTTSGVSTAAQPTSAFGAGKTVVTSQPSIFSSAVTSSQPSIFGGAQSTTSGVSTTTQPTSTFGAGKTVVTSQPSIFSSAVTSSQPSIFGGSQSTTSGVSTTTQPTPIFGAGKTVVTSQPSIFSSAVTSSQPSIFGGSQSTTSGVNTVTQSTSIFGAGKTVATSQPSIFGSAVTSIQPSVGEGTQSTTSLAGTTTQSTSIFGASKTAPTSQPSVFGSAVTSAQPAIFGGGQSIISGVSSTTPTTSIFNAGNTVSPTQSTVFGAAAPSTKPSIFGSSTTAKTTAISIFGNANTTTTQSSIFAIPSTSSSANPSIFGATSASNQSSLFGMNQASSTQGSIFGGAASASSAPIFGSTAETSPAQTSIFGGVKATSTTKPSIFGAPQTSTSQNSIFGGSTVPSTQTPIFGAPSTSATSPFSSGFGTTSTLSSPFGQTSPSFGVPKTTASTFSSGFGSPTGFGATPSTTSSIFGQPASFGNTSTSVFGTPTTATNMFGSSTSTFGANTSANVFGPAASSSSFSFAGTPSNATNTGAFGFGGLNVGSPATTNSVFGGGASFGQATAANPFGRTTEQKSPFGGGSTSIFGNAASSSGSVFGSNTGSTFSSNTQGGFGTSGFGSPSTFGQQSTFGQSSFGNTSFGSPQPGPFSGGSGAVAQTGFGSPQSFAKPSGFGSSPVFGGSPQPAFGAAPSFGGAPAFGAAPAFGSPNKIFGGNTPTASFGSASTGNAGFGNLANQNTVGFGNLAQQAASQNSAPFSGSSSFSTWR